MIEKAKFPIYDFIKRIEEASLQSDVLKAHHRSLYYYLVYVAGSVAQGKTTFTITYAPAMRQCKIGNHRTYKKVLIELQSENLIKYTPGKNGYQAAVIELTIPSKNTSKLLTAYQNGRNKVDRQKGQGKKKVHRQKGQGTHEVDRPKCLPLIGQSAHILNNINNGNAILTDEATLSKIRFNPNPAN